jgi:hypothetical protein
MKVKGEMGEVKWEEKSQTPSPVRNKMAKASVVLPVGISNGASTK